MPVSFFKKNIFLGFQDVESDFERLTFFHHACRSIEQKKIEREMTSAVTLMNKGFQPKEIFCSECCFQNHLSLFCRIQKNKWLKGAVLIHKPWKNVNKILYKIFLVRKNYF